MKEPLARVPSFRTSLSFDNARTWLLLIASIALLGAIYLGQASQAALTGQRVHDLQEKLDRTHWENAQLESEIAVLTTPEKIDTRARQLGLRPATITQTRFLVIKNYTSEPAKPMPVAKGQHLNSTAAHSFDFAARWGDFLTSIGWATSPRAAEATTNP
jgi:hypothetical protein